ncbi:LysR family transcriptional regulator [Rhodococcus sp. BP-332]|uniref:LysR family transcriptional regulator n=1 Tax=Rhodococcus sp. BP-332 TaxID=2739447 RepID=UPI001C9AB03F|nr:LysR family transcriptional regulator [Rhodococcus sp. BP-332]MBY6679305.1 LysR family transcriptional regulator [Rhodococcus sp. BP-332]
MDVHHLRCFDAVARELHFGNAAARLHLTPSPVSRAVKELERELGVDLFVRKHHEIVLTPAGVALAPRARAVLADIADMALIAQSTAPDRARVVRVGGSFHLPPTYFDEFLELVQRVAAPRVVDVVSHPSAQLVSSVEQGELDIAMVYLPVDIPEISVLETARLSFWVAMKSDDPLAAEERVALADLRDRTVAIASARSQPAAVNGLSERLRREVGAVRHLDDTDMMSIANHVRRSDDLTLSLDPAMGGTSRVFDDAAFALRPLDEPSIYFSVGLVWRTSAAAGDRLVDSLVEAARTRWCSGPESL